MHMILFVQDSFLYLYFQWHLYLYLNINSGRLQALSMEMIKIITLFLQYILILRTLQKSVHT